MYQLTLVQGALTPELESEILGFWRANGALPRSEDGARRCREVIFAARAASGELAALCSLYQGEFGEPRRVQWFYRMFVRAQDRHSGLGVQMTGSTQRYLEQRTREPDGPDSLIIVSENPTLMQPTAHAHLRTLGFELQGRDQRGCEVWRWRIPVATSPP